MNWAVLLVLLVGTFVYNTVFRNVTAPDATPRDWLPSTPAGRVSVFSGLIAVVCGGLFGMYLLASPFAIIACGLGYLTVTRAHERNAILIFPVLVGAALVILPIGHAIFA